jgi:hypothetical protein
VSTAAVAGVAGEAEEVGKGVVVAMVILEGGKGNKP